MIIAARAIRAVRVQSVGDEQEPERSILGQNADLLPSAARRPARGRWRQPTQGADGKLRLARVSPGPRSSAEQLPGPAALMSQGDTGAGRTGEVTGFGLAQHLTFDQLLTFKAVVECGSFRQAAQTLMISQPAISQRMRHLEQLLEAPLFDRQRGSAPLLTPLGEHLMTLAQAVLSELEHFASAIDRINNAPETGHFTVASGPSFIKYRLLVVTQEFNRRYPGVQVRLRHTADQPEVLDFVAKGEADLGIYAGRVSTDQMRCFGLGEDRFMLVAPSGHEILSAEVPMRLQILARSVLALPSPKAQSRQLIDGWAHHLRLGLRTIIEADNLDTLKESVLQRVALAILPAFTIGDEIEQGLLRPVPMPGLPLHRHVTAISHPERMPGTAERVFIDILARHIREEEQRFNDSCPQPDWP